MKVLSKNNKIVLNWDKSVLADLLSDLYLWSGADFDAWTISEIIGVVQQQLSKPKET